MTTHELKTWPEFFEEIITGGKTFELRKDDRGATPFRVHDTLHLREWRPIDKKYTGRETWARVTYLMCGPAFGLQPGWVCMAIQPHPPLDGGDQRS